MSIDRKNRLISTLESLLRIGMIALLSMTVIIMLIAVFDRNAEGEAYTGSFESNVFNDGWKMEEEGRLKPVNIPAEGQMLGESVVLLNTLPENLSDGMSLMVKSSMEDVIIYVNGEIRTEYSTDSVDGMSYYIPSAFVVADLNEEDSGKEIKIVIRFKANKVINEISISHGNNVWFSVIKRGLAVNLAALIVLVLGFALTVTALFMGGSFRVGAIRNLGFLMINISLWVISESSLRQFVFSRPSLSRYFSFVLVELIGGFSCMYFDEVQHRVHHRSYLIGEFLVFSQLVVNIILHMTGTADMYLTLRYAHFWAGISALIFICNIISDVRHRRIRSYMITGAGMVCFVILALNELLGFYVDRFHAFGTSMCMALFLLMTTTVIQTVYDGVTAYNEREKSNIAMTISTIETIASAIDARDENTGGHSERVGLYAGRLAREMAADYDLSEEAILRIHYIGLVHDIGKIGVADNVLNKPGRLTDEEYSLMKKHTEIGYEIMSSFGEGVEGLLDGIRFHHERFDGGGYPDGLSDTDIPLIARILALADSYDAMTSNRVYRKRLSDEEVRNELLRCAGTQFDPALTEIFVRLIDRGELRVMTVDGIAADREGNIRNSSILENMLQRDLRMKKNVLNPAHVRMICYIMKLMEKKGRDYRVLISEIKDPGEGFFEAVKEHISEHDMFVSYTENESIIALFDRTEREESAFRAEILKACPEAEIRELSEGETAEAGR